MFEGHEGWIKVAQFVPFLGAMAANVGDRSGNFPIARPVITRLMEAAIIGGVISYSTIQVQGEKIAMLQTSIDRLEQNFDKRRGEIDSRLHDVEKALWRLEGPPRSQGMP